MNNLPLSHHRLSSRSRRSKVVAILALVSTLLFGSIIFIQTLYHQYQQFLTNQASASSLSSRVSITTDPEVTSYQAEYQLLNGWNFVAFPLIPASFSTASELMTDVVSNGGYITTVSMWDGDRWQEFSQRGDEKFGHDFAIEPGQAYFLHNHQTTTWTVIGTPLTKSQVALLSLHEGWNAVGLIRDDYQASLVLDAINQGTEVATEIDWWQSGSWDPFVKRLYSEDNVKTYGHDFPILPTRGYMINLNYPGELAQ